MNKSYPIYIAIVFFVGLPIAQAQPISPRVVDRLENSVVLEWQHGPVPSGTYQLFLTQNNVLVPTSGGGQNPQVVTAPPPLNPGGLVTTRSNEILRPELEYRAFIIGPPPQKLRPGVDINIVVPPFTTGGGPGAGGGPPIVALPDDPLARRIEAASQMVTAQGDFLRSVGENRLLQAEAQRSLAEARVRVAQAVDLELDNWKKHVTTYFDRREENMLRKMREAEIKDIEADKAVEYREKANRRRYEIVKGKASSGSSHDNLNFMLDLFVGTSFGYGVRLEDLVDSTVDRSRWDLTPDMMKRLRVRTPNAGGNYIEFQLNQPQVIAMHWPLFFQQPQFKPYRDSFHALNEALTVTTNREEQYQIINQLSEGFAFLSEGFFRTFGTNIDRRNWSTDQFQQYLRAEEFLAQMNRELRLFRENPESAIRASQTFDPQTDGQDVGTLISWMNAGGLKFAKPRTGDEGVYIRTFNIMTELYGLLGEPITMVEKTENQPSIAPKQLAVPIQDGPPNQVGDPSQSGPPIQSQP